MNPVLLPFWWWREKKTWSIFPPKIQFLSVYVKIHLHNSRSRRWLFVICTESRFLFSSLSWSHAQNAKMWQPREQCHIWCKTMLFSTFYPLFLKLYHTLFKDERGTYCLLLAEYGSFVKLSIISSVYIRDVNPPSIIWGLEVLILLRALEGWMQMDFKCPLTQSGRKEKSRIILNTSSLEPPSHLFEYLVNNM